MKTYTWKDLEEMYEKTVDYFDLKSRELVHNTIRRTPKKYRNALAVAFSVVKWSPNNVHRGEGVCGLCELYGKQDCKGCPLVTRDGTTCNDSGSLYQEADWELFWEKQCGSADKLYNKLVEIYTKEWDKLQSDELSTC